MTASTMDKGQGSGFGDQGSKLSLQKKHRRPRTERLQRVSSVAGKDTAAYRQSSPAEAGWVSSGWWASPLGDVVSNVRVTRMVAVMVTAVVIPSCEHWACKHQQENCCKNLFHGKHPSTLQFPADRRCDTNVPKEKRGEAAVEAGGTFTRSRPFWKRRGRY